ncbi:ABC-F family ATP-binding cassette domain-containing protein [Chakrabartyella piscis]|uniref:ABC-F family ATP-binding cassette domain-containing protein n=1 Tax=Chakrabartyella piscis TaxID=2918914 RepID=UPI0029585253|nr:ATP-binding cassette domain-containing protein [Chakrabartyella piscis]
MIELKEFSYGFPNKDLYDKVSFTLELGQSCAFIGSSGCGKSTLAEILMDPERYMFEGKLLIEEGTSIAYVSQFYDVDKSKTISVFEYIAEGFVAVENELAEVCAKMGTVDEVDETLMDAYQEVMNRFDAMECGDYISNIEKKLALADMVNKRDLDLSKLSGGEFKLIQVIKQMLYKPDLLIMDEPDSFLDFDNLNSLKHLINSYKGTTLTITHSRYLLNHCFNKIIHLENKDIQEFDGRYIEYNFELLEKKIELQELSFKDDEEIARNEALIKRLRDKASNYDSAANGKSLKARVKIQERLQARRIKSPFVSIRKPEVNFVAADVLEEGTALEVNGFNLSFAEDILEDVSFTIGSKDKVGIIGANGAGKTSLIRAIYANQDEAITIPDTTNLLYLSQNKEDTFAGEQDIYDAFLDLDFATYTEVSEYLSKFGFPEEKMTQKIGSLSGGEKNILGLAKLSTLQSNLLILDEPTSHLDTYAQIALEEAIANYEGAVLMISHDFYSIVNCLDYVLIIEDKQIRKMKMKKFKRMIYGKHFEKEYLEKEKMKKEAEVKVETALLAKDFEKAKVLAEDLATIIEGM